MSDNEKFVLTDEKLEDVSGGALIGHISCSNPNCSHYRSVFILGAGATCSLCGWDMEWVDEGFPVKE